MHWRSNLTVRGNREKSDSCNNLSCNTFCCLLADNRLPESALHHWALLVNRTPTAQGSLPLSFFLSYYWELTYCTAHTNRWSINGKHHSVHRLLPRLWCTIP